MPTLNIAGLNRLMEDSSKRDEQIQKETTKGSFRREQNIAAQFANNLQRKDLIDDESEIDPYSSAPKKSKIDLFKISNSKYQTSLLESLVKNQHNKSFNNAVLNYQSSVLTHLEGINDKLEQMISSQTVKEAEERKEREYKREHSELAKDVATGNLEGIYNQIINLFKSNIFKNTGNEMSMLLGMLPMFKTMFTKEGMSETVKSLIPNVVGLFNNQLGHDLKQFQADPINLIQNYIDKLSVSNNPTLAKIFGQFASKGQIQMQDNDRVDMKALAKFDNKVYMSITKIMPDQLIKQTDLLEALVTGKEISPHAWDWENNKLSEVSTLLERQNDDRMTVRKGTDELYSNVMSTITEALKTNESLLSRFDTFLQKDADGRYYTDNNQNYIFNNNAALKDALAAILQSKSNGINQLAGDTNIEQFMSDNKLDMKIVNGKQIKASASEIASRRQIYALLQTLLTQTNLKPNQISELSENVENLKQKITISRGVDIGAYTNSSIMSLYDKIVAGEISPEEFKTRIAITPTGGVHNTQSSNINNPPNINLGANQTDNKPNPKLYKNSQGIMVPFTDLNGYEQENYRRKELSGDLSYGEEAFQKTKLDFDNHGETLTDTQTKILELLNLGIIDHETYTHFMTNSDDPQTKQQIETSHKRLEAAAKYFNKLDRAGLSIRRIRGKHNISEEALQDQGYVSSTADVYRYIGNDGKLNESLFRDRNRSLYTDKTMKMINDINIDKLESEKSLVDSTNPIDSAAELMSTLFGDPQISKAAGFVAGGVGGIGLSKILQMMGKKPGLITKSLPVVMATLMTTNYAQRWANNIFGAEGQIKNDQGYSNRDIFMSKLMLKWLPMLGIGAKTTQVTAKLMSHMGPLGMVFGVPISLASGLLVGTLGTKMLNSVKNKLFSEENQQNGSVWGMAGKYIMEKMPWLGKYLGFGSAGRKSTMNRLYQQEKAKLKTEYNTTFNTLQALQKDPNADPKKIAEAQAKLKAIDDAIKIYSDALKDLDSIPKTNENHDYELNRIESRVQEELGKLAEKDSEVGESIRKSFDDTKDKIESENNFNAASAADQKLDLKGTNAVKQAIRNAENNPDIDDTTRELLDNAKDKISRGESISLEELFTQSRELSDIVKFNQEVRSREYERQIKSREGDTSLLFSNEFRNYQFDEFEKIKNNNNITEAERKQQMREHYERMMNGTNLRNDFENQIQAKENESIYLNSVITTLRNIYPDMSEPELIRLATRITNNNLNQDTLSDKFAKSGIRRKIASVKNTLGSIFNNEEVSNVSQDDMSEDAQFRARMESYYKYMNSPTNEGSGSGVTLSAKSSQYFSQAELAGFKFKDNTSADRIGCALAAFNNMLKFMGMNIVDPQTLIMVAEGHKTSNGISSSVFPHLASPLGLKCKIYTVDDNEKFTASHLTQNSPNKMRGMIILLRDDKNENNHYIAIKSIKRGLVEYLDPEDVSSSIKTGSLSSILLRIRSFIIFEKDSSTSTDLKESQISKDENNAIHRNTIKGQINKGMSRLIDQAKRYGSTLIPDSIHNKITSLKDKIDDGSSSNTSELSVLEKINIGIQSVYEALLNPSIQPVSIYEDQTIPLQTTDKQKAEALIREMSGNGKMSDINLQTIKEQTKDQAVQKESEDSQKVQEAIIEMAKNQKKDKEVIKEATPVEEKAKITDNQPLGGIVSGIKNVLSLFGGIAGSLAGALATIAPAFLLWQNAKGTVGNLKDKFFNMFKAPKDTVYDQETGEVIEEGSYRDFSGMLRDTRNIKNGLFVATDLATNKMSGLVSKLGGKISEKGIDLMGKSKLGQIAGSVINKFGTKLASKANLTGKIVGGGARILHSGMDMIANKTGSIIQKGFEKIGLPSEITTEMIERFAAYVKDKLFTVLNGVQKTVSKIPFLGKYADKFLGKAIAGINKFSKWLISSPAGKKLMAKLAKDAGKTASKSVPFLNIAVLIGSAISAVWNGWRHADQILGIPQDTVTIPLKMTAIAAKMIWDVLPNIFSVIMAYILPGAGALAVDVCMAIIQMFIGFERFLSWFGFDEEWRKEKRKEYTDQKSAEKDAQTMADNIKQAQDDIQSDIDNIQENNQSPELSTESLSLINQVKSEDGETNNTNIEDKTNEDINKPTTNTLTGKAEVPSIWTNIKNNFEKSRQHRLENAVLYSTWGNQYNSLYKVKSEEERQKEYEALMNTPEMKVMKEQWEKSGSEWFHPLGDPNTKVTSAFGPRNVIGASSNHKGIDFSSKGKVGEKIYAAKSGKVITSSPNYGLIEISHPDGTSTRYMHLSERYPKIGAEVSAGDVIGLSGGVGANGAQNAYRPHLHFEIRDSNGNRLDPFLKMGLDPSVINIDPSNSNRENIAYLERHPFLLDKIKNEKSAIEKEKEVKVTKKEETPSIKTKEAGDMPRNAERAQQAEHMKALNDSNKIADNNQNMLIGMMKAFMELQSKTVNALNQINSTLNIIQSHLEENLNNDIVDASARL